MKIYVVVFGTLLVISNIGLANQEFSLQNSSEFLQQKKRSRNTIANDISQHLINRGMEASAVAEMMREPVNISQELLGEFQAILQDVSYERLVKTLATRLLQGQNIDMTRRETLLAVAQSIKGPALDAKTREALHLLAQTLHVEVQNA